MNAFASYRGRKVLVTGHTGFKGSWLLHWLEILGADVTGFSLPPPTEPNHFSLIGSQHRSIVGDIRDADALERAFAEAKPEIVFHLAAQPLVRRSYAKPIETYETNVIGTLKVFEACRVAGTPAIVNVTSDKCYENREWNWGYRENDPMGGYDPYSSSKGCSEILSASYQRSYFPLAEYGKSHHTLLATARAGNVIGGGDWAEDRLIPDAVRSASLGAPVECRNPSAIRPWQHVLEPLSGYLQLGEKLLAGNKTAAEAWNFGPEPENFVSVSEVLEEMRKEWDAVRVSISKSDLHEAHFLLLDSTKARTRLGWRPLLNLTETVRWTTSWYRAYYAEKRIETDRQIRAYANLLETGRG